MTKKRVDIRMKLLLFVIILPFVMTIVFSVPNTDDFSVANRVMQFSNPLVGALYHTKDFYINWSGVYVTALFQLLLNPLVYFPADGFAIGFVLLVSFLLFIEVIDIYFSTICRDFFGVSNQYAVSAITFLFLILFLNSGVYQEIYYWYVGNSYLWLCVLCLINQVLIIIYFKKNMSAFWGVALSIVGFVACVGYYQAVFSGIVYLAAWFHYSRDEKRDRLLRFIPLVFMIVGGCTSVFAPGNFVRHSKITSTGINIKEALLSATQNTIGGILDVVFSPVTVFVVVLAFVIGFKYFRGSKVNPVTLFIMLLFSVMGTAFPVALGYSNNGIPNRISFLINLTTCIYIIFVSLSAGAVLANSEIGKHIVTDSTVVYVVIIALFSFAVVCLQICPDGKMVVEKLPWVVTIENIETVARESEFYKETLNGFSLSDTKEVVLDDFPCPIQTGIIKPLDITDDPEDWRNRGIARYFKLSSVTVINPESTD